jgi:hypothetical protein
MSFGRVLLLGTAAIGGTFIALKPEARQKVKQMVAIRLHKLGNALDPQGPPPMWTDEEREEVPHPVATEEELAYPLEEDVVSHDEEDRTIHGFKVKK